MVKGGCRIHFGSVGRSMRSRHTHRLRQPSSRSGVPRCPCCHTLRNLARHRHTIAESHVHAEDAVAESPFLPSDSNRPPDVVSLSAVLHSLAVLGLFRRSRAVAGTPALAPTSPPSTQRRDASVPGGTARQWSRYGLDGRSRSISSLFFL